MKLRKKIIILYILIIFTIIVIVNIFALSYSRNNIEKQISNYYKLTLEQIEFNINSFFEDIEEDVQNLADMSDVKIEDDSEFTSFLNADKNSFEYNIKEKELKIIDIFYSYLKTHTHVNSVYMGRENGSFVRAEKRAKNTQYDPRERPWYKLGKSGNGLVQRTDVYKSVTTDDLNIGNVISIYDNKNKFLGVVGIDVTLKNLRDYLSELILGYNGEVMLLNNNGVILASNNKNIYFKDFKEIHPNFFENIKQELNEKKYLERKIDHDYYYFNKSEKLDWYIGIKVDSKIILNEVTNFVRRFIIALVVSLLILGITTLMAVDLSIIDPIEKFTKMVEKIKDTGDLEQSVDIEKKDEIGYLAKEFNNMMTVIKNANIKLLQSNDEITKIQSATIYSLASLAETRDPETGEHIKRTQNYVRVIAEYLSQKEKYKNILTEHYIQMLYNLAPLHDIGKVGVPDTVLLKPGKLTAEEFEEMKKHTIYGMKAMKVAKKELPGNSFLEMAIEIVHTHHEKWNGQGYPQGLRGEEIPISGRIMAIADVYDALTSDRVYKKAFSHEEAKKIILEGKGEHFDPEIVDAFIKKEDKFIKIAEKYKN